MRPRGQEGDDDTVDQLGLTVCGMERNRLKYGEVIGPNGLDFETQLG